jgi:Phosphodiester glycosidase
VGGLTAGLVATFNGGFKIKDARGGFYLNGHQVGPLTNGAASLVIYKDRSLHIGSWGRDFQMSNQIVAVRQNLKLLIDHGQLAGNLDSAVQSNWGATIKGAYFVWRSGIGIRADGNFVYAAGDALSVRDLALLLKHAGAVEGMQLDINPAWVSYMWYSHNGSVTPHKLVNFQRPAARYLEPTSRDFIAAYLRAN